MGRIRYLDQESGEYRYEGSRPASAKKTRKKQMLALLTLVVIAGVAFAAGWNPPTTTVHSFTEASDYNPERESGCTNSGDGCHGSDADYKDFNAYHPDTGCTTCHDYQGVGCIPCHKPENTECVTCHDGTFPEASDCIRLADPYPKGHYRETTHTATAQDMTAVVRASDGGKAGAECGECHSRDLAKAHTGVPVVEGSEYGSDIGCSECHNDTRSRGLTHVKDDWKARTCEDCHAGDSSAPMHAADIATSVEPSATAGCGDSGTGCHASNDLHALHPDAPETCSGSAEDGEPGCHDLEIESHKPAAKGCGGGGEDACHRAYESDSLSHEEDGEVHSPKTDTPAQTTSFHDTACGDCHYMDPDGVSLITEHDLGTSARTGSAEDGCRNCHDHPASLDAIADDWADRDTWRSCDVCHDGDALDAPHEGDITSIHTVATGSGGCANSGPGCHPTADLSSVGSPTTSGGLHGSCLRCHDKSASGGNLAYDPAATTCGSGRACHGSAGAYDPATGVHFGAGASRTDGGDSEHHTAGSIQRSAVLADAASGLRVSCGTCHDMRLGAEHARPNSSIDDDTCTGCHNASEDTAEVVKTDWPGRESDGACDTCHDGPGMPTVHAKIGDAHTATEINRFGDAEAGACKRGGCHVAIDVRVVHKDVGCDIDGCHGTTGDIRGDRIMSCGGLDGQAVCHSASERHRGADDAHLATEINRYDEPEVGACARPGCHETRDVRELHETTHCSTPGCHVVGGPTYMTCGGTDAMENVCHTSSQRHADIVPRHQATEINRYGEPEAGACQRPGCHVTIDVRELHETLHCSTPGCHVEGGPTFMSCGGPDGTEGACHTSSLRHSDIEPRHQATEINRYGEPEVGACQRPGCHVTIDVRELHETTHCSTPGCHVEGGPTFMSCGGPDGTENVCHTSSQRHASIEASHVATEINRYGEPEPGACQRAGCHTTIDVRELHETTHCSTPGCHVEGGPTYMSCGGPDGTENVCHTSSQRHASIEASHVATEINRYGEPEAGACQRPGCHVTIDVRELHETTHCSTPGCHVEGGPTYMSCGGPDGTESVCHTSSQRHASIETSHVATEYAPTGIATPGACAREGCHVTVDARALHETLHCSTPGCHVEGGPTYMSCGGTGGQENCHLSFAEDYHMQDHSADLTGTVSGIPYGFGENAGCLGACHATDLVAEHAIRLAGGTLEGGGTTVCRICHYAEEDPGVGAYAGLPAVEAAIAAHDRRCVSCHASGSSVDGPDAAASPPPATCIPDPAAAASVEPHTTPVPRRLDVPASTETTVPPVAEKPEPAPERGLETSATAQPPEESVEPEPAEPVDPEPVEPTEPPKPEGPVGSEEASGTRTPQTVPAEEPATG